jgi:hypothetical protein
VQSFYDGEVKPIGARLVEKHGKEAVASVRYVGRTCHFDNLPGFMSKTPAPKDISRGEEVVIIPDSGPVKGDERVSAADYIITVI